MNVIRNVYQFLHFQAILEIKKGSGYFYVEPIPDTFIDVVLNSQKGIIQVSWILFFFFFSLYYDLWPPKKQLSKILRKKNKLFFNLLLNLLVIWYTSDDVSGVLGNTLTAFLLRGKASPLNVLVRL